MENFNNRPLFIVKQLNLHRENKEFQLLFWCGDHDGNISKAILVTKTDYMFISRDFTYRTQFIWRP